MMAQPLAVGTTAKYFSQSYDKWIDCTVEQVRSSGEIQVSCKPGYWMPPAEQAARLHAADARAEPGCGCKGAAAPSPPGAAGAQQVAHHPASPSRCRSRKSTYTPEVSLDQRERIRAILESQQSLKCAASAFFNRFDIDHDGLLQACELRQCLLELNRELGIPMPTESQTDMLIKKYDTDRNGALKLNEFQQFYQQVLLRSRRTLVQWKAHGEFFVQKVEGDPWVAHEHIRKLGEGTFGVTHLVKDRRNGQMRVLKAVNKARSNMSPEELEQEIRGLKMLDHPHVSRFFEHYEDAQHIFLLLEEASGGELAGVIREHHCAGSRVSERWAATVMLQVLRAIAYCHGRQLMHKDLKSENIMLLRPVAAGRYPHAVIIDLGIAEMFSSGPGGAGGNAGPAGDAERSLYQRIRSCHAGGTPYTMAPEVWMAYQGKGTFGMKCDVYSLGVVLFQLLTGKLPFMVADVDASEWLAKISRGPPMEALASSSSQAQGLCRVMLAGEAQRPTAREALGHEWFTLKGKEAVMHLSDSLRTAFCEFGEKNEFHKAVLLQAATQMRAADLPRVNAIFCTYDAECMGYLSTEQLVGALKGKGVDEASAQRVAASIDLDKNGRIEYTEFVAACMLMHGNRLEAFLWQIFQQLCAEGSSVLTRAEIEQFLRDSELRGLGFAPSGAEIQQIVQDLNRNRSGQISFDEFRLYLMPGSSCVFNC